MRHIFIAIFCLALSILLYSCSKSVGEQLPKDKSKSTKKKLVEDNSIICILSIVPQGSYAKGYMVIVKNNGVIKTMVGSIRKVNKNGTINFEKVKLTNQITDKSKSDKIKEIVNSLDFKHIKSDDSIWKDSWKYILYCPSQQKVISGDYANVDNINEKLKQLIMYIETSSSVKINRYGWSWHENNELILRK